MVEQEKKEKKKRNRDGVLAPGQSDDRIVRRRRAQMWLGLGRI